MEYILKICVTSSVAYEAIHQKHIRPPFAPLPVYKKYGYDKVRIPHFVLIDVYAGRGGLTINQICLPPYFPLLKNVLSLLYKFLRYP